MPTDRYQQLTQSVPGRFISKRLGLPQPPRLYYIPSRMLNAFAVGHRDEAAIAVTNGLLRGLTLREGSVKNLGQATAHPWLIGLTGA